MVIIKLKEIINELDNWKGGTAQFWNYTASHGQFVLRVKSKNKKGNIHLILEDCYFLSGVVAWNNINIEVVENSNSEESTYTIQDKNNNFIIKCNFIKIQPDVEPIY